MNDFEYTKHTIDMIIEREIQENWISDTINDPDFTEFKSDEVLHFIKQKKSMSIVI